MSKENPMADPLRVVVWSTGGVGSVAIDAIRRRPDLELVGVWVHSLDKVGSDAGELGGGDPMGLAATNDADALIALRPECVVYAASGPQRDAGAIPDYLKLLGAGINVVSTSTHGYLVTMLRSSAPSTPLRIAGMNSFGTLPPRVASTNSKSAPIHVTLPRAPLSTQGTLSARATWARRL